MFFLFSEVTIVESKFCTEAIYPPETVENFETIDLHFRRTSQTQFTSQTGLETTITTAINPEFGTFPKFLYKFMFFSQQLKTNFEIRLFTSVFKIIYKWSEHEVKGNNKTMTK